MARRDGKAGRKGGKGRARGRGKPRRTGTLTPERVLAVLARRGRELVTPAALAADLGVGRGAQKPLRAALRLLESKGRVERIRGRYRARRKDGALEGIYTREGQSGVVVDDTGRRWQVGSTHDAKAGDRVTIRPWGDPPSARADVLQVVEGVRDHWVGILHRRGRLAFATPYRDDGEWLLRVARSDMGGAADGDVVVLVPARSRGKASSSGEPFSRVDRVLGRPGDTEADVAAVVWRHRLPGAFSPEVEQEALACAGESIEAEIAKRVDLRELPFVTIDPENARDHDDAITVESLPDGGARLHVAIADVSHYVTEGSRIDREALGRGNSTYFPDRALPMLPPSLSGDACSLREGRDRLALVVEIVFDAAGRPNRRGFYPAVIRSRAHLPYERASAIMQGEQAHAQGDMLRRLDALAQRLAKRRRSAGALFLNLPEAAIRFDSEGTPVDVQRAAQGVAHRAVEESMLAANREVARVLVEAEAPGIFRNHDSPSREDTDALGLVLGRFGLHDGGPLTATSLAGAVRAAKEPVAGVVHRLVLRAMRQARYSGECRGHFALASEAYLHFTSPIRRYPDLVVHRVLKSLLSGGPVRLDAVRSQRIAALCSFRERRAERAERELIGLKKCQFLAGHVGEELEGCVTGVARHGVYVTLDRWPIEGLVHVSSLPEFVTLDEQELSLVAERSRRRYALGDRVRVGIVAVDPIQARIDFEIRRVLEVSPLFARR